MSSVAGLAPAPDLKAHQVKNRPKMCGGGRMSAKMVPAAANGLQDRPGCPAEVGMAVDEVDTPALVIDLDAFEANLHRLAKAVEGSGVRLRPHGKTHKSVDIAKRQISRGGAIGLCCQKVSEAEVFAAGGIGDILISNEVVSPRKIGRLAELARLVKVSVCVDDFTNVTALGAAARAAGSRIGCLVEVDVGAGRCGVSLDGPVAELCRAVMKEDGLVFEGLQAYHGPAQHQPDFLKRSGVMREVIAKVRDLVGRLEADGLTCPTVAGAGTGTFAHELGSGVYNEIQCGSYIFMDAAYAAIEGEEGPAGSGAPSGLFQHALFVLSSIMSNAQPGKAVCDTGHKSYALDSGYPVVFGRPDLRVTGASDEHGEIADPENSLSLNDRIWLVPGHCDPTCNLHDFFVGVRAGRVEELWPVSARGCVF